MNRIDEWLLLITKYTDGQVPYGMLADIAKILGVSRERVRQRADKIGLARLREINDSLRRCRCGIDFRPRFASQKYHAPSCASRLRSQDSTVYTRQVLIDQLPAIFTSKHLRTVFGHKELAAYMLMKRLREKGFIKQVDRVGSLRYYIVVPE